MDGHAAPKPLETLVHAQKTLLEEAVLGNLLCTPEQLLPLTLNKEFKSSAARWQWSAMQCLFYGSECYLSLLKLVRARQP